MTLSILENSCAMYFKIVNNYTQVCQISPVHLVCVSPVQEPVLLVLDVCVCPFQCLISVYALLSQNPLLKIVME